MTQKEIVENNKLIAEFMGIVVDDYCIIDFIAVDFIDLKYHSSWDWLMPCIQKILELDEVTEDMEHYYTILDNIPDIKATYQAVVEFIKWYKENGK